MKVLAIVVIVIIGTAADLAILGVGVWLTFFLNFSFWWWVLIFLLSWGETTGTYKFINAVNGAHIKLQGERIERS